jgi:hypothetical protein
VASVRAHCLRSAACLSAGIRRIDAPITGPRHETVAVPIVRFTHALARPLWRTTARNMVSFPSPFLLI